MPKSLGNCVNMDEFNIEGNNISQLPVRTIISEIELVISVALTGTFYMMPCVTPLATCCPLVKPSAS